MNDEHKELLPDKICYKCSDALQSAAQIRSLCLESDRYLKRQLIDLNLVSPMKFEETLKENSFEENFVEVHLEEEVKQLEDHHDDEYYAGDVEAEQVDYKFTFNDYNGEANYQDDELYNKKAVLPSFPKSKAEVKPTITHEVCEICGKTYVKGYIAHHLRTHDSKRKKAEKFQCKFN